MVSTLGVDRPSSRGDGMRAYFEAKAEAERQLTDRKADFDYARAQAELAEAVAQLRTIQHLREKTKR